MILLETRPPPEGFEARARAREAREVVNGLYAELTFAEDVASRLRAMKTPPGDIRRAALELVEARGDHIGWLNSDAVYGYGTRDLSDADLRVLLRKIQLVNRLQPGVPEYVANLGKCQYRAGLHREALASLSRAQEMYRAAGQDATIEDLAFAAMAHHAIGEAEAARLTLLEMDARLAALPEQANGRVLDSIYEARALSAAAR
jgi:hypothetical protein